MNPIMGPRKYDGHHGSPDINEIPLLESRGLKKWRSRQVEVYTRMNEGVIMRARAKMA